MIARSHLSLKGRYKNIQLVLTSPGLLGFVQVKLETNFRGTWGTDNYLMVGAPNGGGVWTEF